jgi:hypothetical protein
MLKSHLVSQQSVTKLISMIAVNLVTHKAEAKLDLLFNISASEAGLLNI